MQRAVPWHRSSGCCAPGKTTLKEEPTVCNYCETIARVYRGGAEVELTLLFADVRGSTTLAERVTASEFSRLMNRFYDVATRVD